MKMIDVNVENLIETIIYQINVNDREIPNIDKQAVKHEKLFKHVFIPLLLNN